MTEESLLVDEVDVVRAPGFDTDGLPVADLSPGVNVIHGPNASGKTTLARSLQWLLWPDTATERASLTGRLSLDGAEWRVEVDPGSVRYQRDGRDSNGPTLPPADQMDRYRLSLHELLQSQTQNEDFAQTIKRESAGGYDLSAAHAALGFDDSTSTRGKKVVKEAEQARENWREAIDGVEALRREQRRLSTLRTELDEARRAREEVRCLEQAIGYARAREERQTAKEKLAEFPDVLSRIGGDEADDVNALETRIGELETEKENAREDRATAQARLAETELPEDGVPDGFVSRLKTLRDDLSSLETDRKQSESELATATRRRETARSDIPLSFTDGDPADLEPDIWEEVSAFARTAERVRAEREIQDSVEKWLAEDTQPAAELSTFERGSRALENWLASPPEEATDDGNTAFKIATVSAVLLAVAGGLLGLLVNPVFLVFIPVAVGIGLSGYRARDGTEATGNPRTSHRATFENLSLEPPASWDESAVRDRLNDIYDEIAAHRVSEQREQLRKTLEKDAADLSQREQTLKDKRTALEERLGAAPDTTDVELLAITRGILRWQAANDRVLGLRDEIDEIDDQIDTTRDEIRAALRPYGYDGVSTAAEATEQIRDLEARQTRYRQAKRDIEQAEQAIEDADDTISTLESERAEIFDTIGLDPGEDARLRELCETVDAYQDAQTDLDNAKHLAEKEASDLEAFPDYEPEMKDRAVPVLEREKRELEAVADDYEDVQTEIAEIEAKIEKAKGATEVEDALTEKERALDELGDQLQEDYASMVGDVLTDHVREVTQETSRPDVFNRAREVLAIITNGRYRLDLEEDEDTFRAYDTVAEKGFALDGLSSATRLQLLLAVRIAFVELQERDVRLPLLLDETLANSDDGKAEVIIDSVIELAREGRQVFYFTAQGDEVAKWVAALEDSPEVEHTVTDLAEIRNLDGNVDVPALDEIAVPSPAVPDPEGHDHESYGEAIDVPPFDPRNGAGGAHVWYVVDDVDLLSHLLGLGIEQWGQLDTLLSRTDGEVITDDPDVRDALERTGAALEEFVRSWKTGRGKRVDRQALEDSGAVSGTFIDDVAELAEDLNGEADRIIEALADGEVDRFRSDKTEALRLYFESEGYIEPRDPLDSAEIHVRVIDSLVSSGVARDEAGERAEQLITRLKQY